jgi:hypothetical protein
LTDTVRQPEAKRTNAGDTTIDEQTLCWTAHPAKGRPGVAIVVGCVVLCGAISAVYWLESPLYALIAAAVLIVALLPFFLRTHYTLGPAKLTVRTVLYGFEREMTAFRAFEVSERAIWLCTLRKRSTLDNYRGMPLYLDGNAESVRAALTAAGLEERK